MFGVYGEDTRPIERNYVKPCPECKLFSMYLSDPCYIWYGRLLKEYTCDECGHKERK